MTDQEINQIGLDHNRAAEQVLQNVNMKTTDWLTEGVNAAIKANSKLDGQQSGLKELYTNYSKFTMDGFYNFVDSNPKLFNNAAAFKSFAGQIDQAINTTTNVRDLTSRLATIETNAKAQLKGNDLTALQISLSVTRNSATFWSPTAQGGSGIGDGYINQAFANRKKPTLRQFMRTDGISASIGFLGLAAVTAGLAIAAGSAGLATPAIVAIAELCGIGFTSALSSLSLFFVEI